MSDPVWLSTAKTLSAGRRVRIKCCASDTSMIVSNEVKGYRAYCFRCGPVGFVAHGDFSIDALRRRRSELEWSGTKTVSLPKDFTTDIPPSEAVWLYRAGISTVIAKQYGFGYSPSIRRIILPVYKDGVLQAYTARSTIGERPKYIERSTNGYALFSSIPTYTLPTEEVSGSLAEQVHVFTEDILSAVRVGRVSGQSYALMGTTADHGQLQQILKGVSRIAIWLDPDKAGRTGRRKLARSLALLGYEPKIIKSNKDPKYYSSREIRRMLLSI